MKKVRKAIIPAAGLGTRFLPVTKAMPKEMLPIVDKPTIQYIVEEAIESGIEDIIIVTGKGKRAIEDHFDHSFELEQTLLEKGKHEMLEKVQASSKINIHYIRQKEPKGLGHAVWCARKFIGNEPFAVLLGDDIVQAETPCLRQLMDQYEGTQSSVIGVQTVPENETHRYGIIDPIEKNERRYQVRQFVEKPAEGTAPSNLAIMGRYVLTPEIFMFLENQQTGAGGSIGSEICRQVMKYKPAKIVLLGHGENSIYNIEMEMRVTYKDMVEITTEIADIQDRHKIFEIMKKHQPYIVYHAAAHKHVPLMERNPEEAVKNNIFGTKNVAEAADTFKVNTFVMVSTDKAVNPTNVMGATKRFAEMLVQHMASVSTGTRFVAVRFGNVLGSRGSVIPLFKKQIQKGGPVTVTHPDMIRYFMTIPEASRLVIQAGTLARGGELFVLDMGDPVKIVDLAKNLITLSGYSIEEIGIEFTGLRPGEKMYEELLNEGEIHPEQIFPKIHIGKAVLMDQAILRQFMNDFEGISKEEIRERLLDIANNKVNLNN